MLKRFIPSWIRNAAAALCGRHGAVTERAEEAGCSRQTVYDHAERLLERVTADEHERDTLRAEVAQLQAEAERLWAEVDPQESAWQRARAALAVFRPDGTLNERAWAEAEIQAALTDLRGPEWKKVRNFLNDARTLKFVDRLHRRLAEAEPDANLRKMAVRRWWLRHQASQPTPSTQTAPTALTQVQMFLDAKVRAEELTSIEQAAYDRVAHVLRTTVRASSAVEGINSVLRMQQGRQRQMTQGLLDLKRLYWNCRRLQTGKRRGRCPYEMLGVALPSHDFWTLLRAAPEPAGVGLTEQMSAQADRA